MCPIIKLTLAPALVHTNMSGSGRARTSSFAEPPGAPGSAAAGAGSAVAGGSSTGKAGAAQATGSSSMSFGNLKLPSEYCLEFPRTDKINVTTNGCVLRNLWQNSVRPCFIVVELTLAAELTKVSCPANVTVFFIMEHSRHLSPQSLLF